MSAGGHADCSSWCHLKAHSGAVTGVGQDGSSLGSWGEGQGIEVGLVHWLLGKLEEGHTPHGPLEKLVGGKVLI